MKKLLLFICLTLSISTIGQSKYSYKKSKKFLSKSEKLYSENKFEKSLIYLNKYENSLPGFCGLGYFIFEKSIFDLKLKNYLGLKKFDDALLLIDNKEESFTDEIQKNDSLKVEILFLKYGKEKVKKSFQNCKKITAVQDNYLYIYSLHLIDINYIFTFRKVETIESELEFKSSQYDINKLLIDNTIFKLIF